MQAIKTYAILNDIHFPFEDKSRYQVALNILKAIKPDCLGWLGDKSRHVFDYRGAKDSWVTGMTVVEADPQTGQYTLDFIVLDKIPVLYRGALYNAKDKK